MPAKRTRQSRGKPADTDFVLKHRIAGAAFLLFFGALLLPWLLGAPSQANKSQQQSPVAPLVNDNVEAAVEDIEKVEAPVLIDEQEKVYVSKITPLDSKLQNNVTGANRGEAGASKASDPGSPASIAQPNAAREKESAAKKSKQQTEDESASRSRELASGEAESAAEKVDVGWAVQVGVFTDKQGAARVVQDLRDKGFAPSTSIVDTNRGKATGTRIWLGPFAQRVDAAKAKTQLTAKTGEAGFIRAYP